MNYISKQFAGPIIQSFSDAIEDFFNIPDLELYRRALGDADIDLSTKEFHTHQAIQSFLSKC